MNAFNSTLDVKFTRDKLELKKKIDTIHLLSTTVLLHPRYIFYIYVLYQFKLYILVQRDVLQQT